MNDLVTRLEVIDETGRVYTRRPCSVELSWQDGGRTLKVFVKPLGDSEAALAERIARAAHRDQKDRVTGAPYVAHLERVAAMVRPEARAVAWLHDVIEDTELTKYALGHAGLSPETVGDVWVLTRTPSLPYEAYIRDIKIHGSTIAREVKIADLRDHLRPNCPASLRYRYSQALDCLLQEGVVK